MNAQEADRLRMLIAGPCATMDYVRDYYGLGWPLEEDLDRDFRSWQASRSRRDSCGPDQISRYELETFTQQRDLVPKKWMAARLGMDAGSLDEILTHLPILKKQYAAFPDLIGESLPEALARSLPDLRFRTFANHDAFCTRLHTVLEESMGIQVNRLLCATSSRLGENPVLLANDFDTITLQPLSLKHQVWLDFRKPFNLRPDRCSKLFYAENRNILQPYRFVQRDPVDIEEYIPVIAERRDA